MSQSMQGHPRAQVIVKSSDKMWSTREGNGNPFQYSCLENPIDSMKRKKDMTAGDDPTCQKMSNMLLGKSRGQLLTAPERWKRLGQSGNDTQLWICLVVKVWPWSKNEVGQRLTRVLSREHAGHNKHSFLTTQEMTLHMDITR